MTLMSPSGCPRKTSTADRLASVEPIWPNEVSAAGAEEAAAGAAVAGAGGAGGVPGKPRGRPPSSGSRLRVEKIEGGLMVAGVVVAANCQVILPIFGFLFLLVGCVLTAASYRARGEGEELDHYVARIASGQSRVLGPACVVGGLVMLAAWAALVWLARRARRRQRNDALGFHCPLHGDFYTLGGSGGSGKGSALLESGTRNSSVFCWPRRRGPGGAVAVGPPQCPHSRVSSSRSSPTAGSPHSLCPTPLPFLVNAGSVVGCTASTGVSASARALAPSPDRVFGSVGSLAAPGREVASFPLSRTPTPPPSAPYDSRNPNLVQVPDEERLVDSHFEPVPVHREGPRKSVSIVLPIDETAG